MQSLLTLAAPFYDTPFKALTKHNVLAQKNPASPFAASTLQGSAGLSGEASATPTHQPRAVDAATEQSDLAASTSSRYASATEPKLKKRPASLGRSIKAAFTKKQASAVSAEPPSHQTTKVKLSLKKFKKLFKSEAREVDVDTVHVETAHGPAQDLVGLPKIDKGKGKSITEPDAEESRTLSEKAASDADFDNACNWQCELNERQGQSSEAAAAQGAGMFFPGVYMESYLLNHPSPKKRYQQLYDQFQQLQFYQQQALSCC